MTGNEITVRPQQGTLAQRLEFARELAASNLLPPAFRGRPENLLLISEYADALRIPLIEAIQGVAIINGVPTAGAHLLAALCRRAGHRLRISGDEHRATATVIRRDDPDQPFTCVWTVERAKTAGLLSKGGPWTQHRAAMLRSRAISEVVRMACSEVLFGLYSPDEIDGAVVDEGFTAETGPPPKPRPAPPRAAAAAAAAPPDPVVVDLADPEPAAPTIADDLAEQWANRWHLDLDQAITALDLPAVQELATAASAAGYPDLIQDARTAWGTVQQRLVDNDQVRRRQPADPAVDLQDADPDADARQQLHDDQVAGQLTIDEAAEG